MPIDLPGDRIRVIVCDDNERDLRSVVMTLSLNQRLLDVVGSTTSAAKLLSLAKKTPFDVAVIDLQMPRIDGLEAADRLKEAFPHCKVVILTSHDDRREDAERSPNVDLFCEKIEVETLDHRIGELMGRQGEAEAAAPARPGLLSRIFDFG